MRFPAHGPAWWLEGSPGCHHPSGGDVACCVDVSVAHEPADDTLESRLALAVVRCDVPTSRASLRCICGVDSLHSSWSLVFKAGDQATPSIGQDAAVQDSLPAHVVPWSVHGSFGGTGHATDVQILHSNQVEPASEVGGRLFNPVSAPIAFPCLQPRDRLLDLGAPVRPALASRQPTMQSPKTLLLARCQCRHAQQLPGRQCSGHGDAAVHSHCLPVARAGDRRRDRGKGNMPPASSVARDAIGLHALWNLAGPTKTNPSDLRYPDLTVTAVDPPDMVRTDRDLPKPLVPSCLTPRRSPMRAAKEAGHCLGEVSQRLLLNRYASRSQPCECSSGFGQLTGLLVVTRCRRASLRRSRARGLYQNGAN
ncbi:hypothetical protein JOF56_004117 [Kibdelosporangium banguiense]|uniref:Uncharacterized protein n=1 Tax=Kibdelosporangium banguiense TaxID=1365924 RepID=A0ABS4TH26_9PSEU|nr:hypothetical protein [Kibdelosporangium banguiense]